MNELQIDEEIKNLIPKLTDEEYKQLEENIITEGCREPIVVWNNTLNRYYSGCNYLVDNPEQFDKYIDNVIELKTKIDKLLEQIMKEQEVTEDETFRRF